MAVIVKGKNARKPFTVRYRHDGKQRERSFATRKEATDFRIKFEHDSREQVFVDPRAGNIRFRAAAKSWLERYQGAPRSKAAYTSVLNSQILDRIGDRTLRSVASDREAMEKLLIVTLPEANCGRSWVSTAYIVIGAIVRDAVRSGKLPAGAVKISRIRLPAAPAKPTDFPFPSRAQLEALADEMPAPYGFTVWLMRGCGLRVGEALAVSHDSLANGTLRLTEQLSQAGTYAPLKHRTAEQHRDIPLPAYVAQKAPEGTGRIFPVVHRTTYERWFRAARKAAGIGDGFTSHSLRHVYASVALSHGIPITDVSAWLGHRNIQTTYGIYGHLVPSAWGRARAVLDREYQDWSKQPGSPDGLKPS